MRLRFGGAVRLPGELYRKHRDRQAAVSTITQLGGWKAVRTLDLYQQPSDDMMLEALAKRRELREKAGT